VRKRRFWMAWTSMSNLGIELIPTSTFPHLALRMGGEKYGSFLGTMSTCRFPCSRVATPAPAQLGVWSGPEGPPQAATPVRGHPTITMGRVDGRGPSVNLFNHRVQLLRQRVMTILMYLGSSCPNRPFSEELGNAEINTHVHRVLAHGVVLNPLASPTPLSKGVDSTRVSLFAFTFGNLRHLICL
jgi:hypothetical protein